jgi:hypothetical protein
MDELHEELNRVRGKAQYKELDFPGKSEEYQVRLNF